MGRFMRGVAGMVAAVALATAFAPQIEARPLTPAEHRYLRYQSNLPECANPAVLDTISSRFSQRDTYYWGSNLAIAHYGNIRETGYRSNGVDYIPRRYCTAEVVLNDDKTYKVTYSIGEDLGMAGADFTGGLFNALTFGLLASRTNLPLGINWGVEWCVSGLDRSAAFGLNCRAAGP